MRFVGYWGGESPSLVKSGVTTVCRCEKSCATARFANIKASTGALLGPAP
jgi:hypothetical protein